ncbi:unnamed protein product [Caenorhabditis angaria]|uniref:C-type lectin domain-containing protein n=1 Tax=Caenorhabditis angaria TaxID=860376 RepID=A0A9P1NAA8_9PELO|nr:unnamed protein product [Caenorhabditis angaria]
MNFVFAFSLIFLVNSIVSQQCSTAQIAYYSSCLQFIKTPLDFNTANSICSGFSGSLVSIHNPLDNQNVVRHALQYTNGPFWVGAKSVGPNVVNPSNWYWSDGSDFNYQNYQASQPVSQGSTSCIQVLSSTSRWFTANCTASLLPFVCQIPAQIAPTTIPAPTCPTVTCPAQTCPTQTCPTKVCPTPTCPTVTCPASTCPTPTAASSCPSGYTWFEYTDFCYKNYVQTTTFDVARNTCIADGGELASIHSQAENDFLVDFTKSGIANTTSNGWNEQVWIGYIYKNQTWQWTDGTISTFVNWAVGEPNKMNVEFWTSLISDSQLVLDSYKDKWNNVGNITERAFVCKHAVLH